MFGESWGVFTKRVLVEKHISRYHVRKSKGPPLSMPMVLLEGRLLPLELFQKHSKTMIAEKSWLSKNATWFLDM